MLVLSRKTNEAIVLDGQITIHVVAIQGSRVRLAIDAPDDVRIHRSELWVDCGHARLSETEIIPGSAADQATAV